jgi:UDP-3-O-[3-hydroxymyristoyl] glucosamine N-acyltransferase
MKIKVQEIASFINAKIIGDSSIEIENVTKIESAKAGDLTFLYLSSYEKYFENTKASAIIVKNDFIKSRKDITYLEVNSPEKAFFSVIKKYFSPEFSLSGIDSTAFISQSVKIGKNVSVGKNVIISEGCIIGDNTKIYHNTVILENTEIGDNCLIFPNVNVRENCKIGNRVIIHSGTVIGSDGFGFSPDEKGVYQKIPQIGNVIIEDDVELGSNVSVDRAAIGSTIIKRGCKIDNLVQIAHNVIIGEDTVISAQAGISGSTKIGNHCILAGQAGLVGHIEIGDNVVITAQAGVSKSLLKPGYYSGTPASEIKSYQKLHAQLRYVPDYIEEIKNLKAEIKQLKEQIDKK